MKLFTDSSANLPETLVAERDISVIPLTLMAGSKEIVCFDPAGFDGEAFYDMLRREPSLSLKTSMTNSAAFEEAFTPALEAGEDVLYVAMSSGISGTYHAARMAAEELGAKYPERKIFALDTLGASLGEGFLAVEAADMRDRGDSIEDIYAFLENRRHGMNQFFMVDDLGYLKRGGRISGAAALAGTLISLKPILKGDEEGRIVLAKKLAGRKKAFAALAELFEERAILSPDNLRAGIAHAGCEKDAAALADAIRNKHPEVEFTIVCYEPGTGAHVGPGTVALFFFGKERGERRPVIPAIRAKLAADASALKAEIEQKLKKD